MYFKRYLDFALLVFVSTSILTFGCAVKHNAIVTSSSEEPEFKNEGEHAAYETKKLFEREYRAEHYEKYGKPIIKNGLQYQYGEMTIIVGDDPVLIAILDNGLLYPDILGQAFKYEPKIKVKINRDSITSLVKSDTNIALFSRSDTLRISDFEEMKFVESSPKQKRFRLWVFQAPMFNPTEYYLELTNQNATIKTDLLSFIKGSKLTYFKNGGIII